MVTVQIVSGGDLTTHHPPTLVGTEKEVQVLAPVGHQLLVT